mgnify:CR=1 FL=1
MTDYIIGLNLARDEYNKDKEIVGMRDKLGIMTPSAETPEKFVEGAEEGSIVKNTLGRIYENDILTKEVDRYSKEFIDKKRAFGELGHPDGPVVNLERVSHMITSLKSEGKNFIGEAKIMDTPYGKIVKGLIDEGAQLGVSSRGMGSLVQKGGANYVGKDFYLATAADIVADPSAPDAFVEGIMENKEWVWDNGVIKACLLYTSDAADE